MLLALATSLAVHAAPPPETTGFTAPAPLARYSLVDTQLSTRNGALPRSQPVYYDSPGWLLTGLGLLGGGAMIMGVAAVGLSATDNAAVDTVFSWTGLFGAVHFVVGATMLGIELTEARPARIRFTGTGFAGRF